MKDTGHRLFVYTHIYRGIIIAEPDQVQHKRRRHGPIVNYGESFLVSVDKLSMLHIATTSAWLSNVPLQSTTL